MSKYRELELLKEQEKTLMQMHMKFNDQLNRLKVEELALTNLLRLDKEREMQAQTGAADGKIGPAEEAIEEETLQVLNLLVSKNPEGKGEAEEEDEEEDEEEEEQMQDDENASYNDHLSNFLEGLLLKQKQQSQQQQQAAAIKNEQQNQRSDSQRT